MGVASMQPDSDYAPGMLQESDSKRTVASVIEVVLYVEFRLCSRSMACVVGTVAGTKSDLSCTPCVLQKWDFKSQGSSQKFCSWLVLDSWKQSEAHAHFWLHLWLRKSTQYRPPGDYLKHMLISGYESSYRNLLKIELLETSLGFRLCAFLFNPTGKGTIQIVCLNNIYVF